MKSKLSEEILHIIKHVRKWLNLNVEFYKLTLAEKLAIFASAAVAGVVCLALLVIILILLSQSLVEVFRPMVGAALAYLIVAGIYLVLMVLIYLLRGQLIGNHVARFVSRLLFDKKEEKKTDNNSDKS